jgi:cytochrome c556
MLAAYKPRMRKAAVPIACCLSVLGLGLLLGSFPTASDADVANDRAASMKRIRSSYRVLVDMAKAGEFDATKVQSGAFDIVAELIIFKDLFPAGSENADQASRLEIWTDRAGFDAAWEAGDSAASTLGAVTSADAFVPALETLAAACRGCHKKYVTPQ